MNPKTSDRSRRKTRLFFALMAAMCATFGLVYQMYNAPRVKAVSTNVVISQIYGGGGNTGATYTHDFIELFNRGNTTVSLAGWSVQYASATGTGNFGSATNLITPLSGSIAPGQYVLIQEASTAAVGAPLPPPDITDATPILMSGTAGKVALVNSTTPLGCNGGSTPCGAAQLAQIVDLVGYGNANFFEGAAAAQTLSNSTGAFRDDDGCVDTDHNLNDFTSAAVPISPGTPVARNTSSPFKNCGGTPTPTPSPTLTISNVTQAETHAGTTTFMFNVNLSTAAGPGGVTFTVNTADGTTNPANAGSDYVAIVNGSESIAAGGSSTTVGVTVSGDLTPEANETFFVNLSNITGTTNSTAQGLGTITNDDVTLTPIYTIQGPGMSSPLVGNTVSTTGIVTGKRSFGASNNGFYIQDPNGDGNPATSDGILVFTGSTVPNFVNVGDFVQVTGNVAEFESSTSDEPDGVAPADPKTITELTGTTTIVISPSTPLPAPVDITSNNILDPVQTSRGAQLERYEFMRLSVNSLVVCEPSNNFGEFYGVEPIRPRPFREPGIEAGDPVPNADEAPYAPGPPPFPPRFDGNFERIMVDSGAALTTGSTRRPQVQVTTGTLVTNIVGPLDYTFDAYRIVLDANVTPGVSGGMTAAAAVPARAAGEFTIGHTNLENFGRSNGALVFPGRLNKASLAIRNVLQTPDIVGVIEVFDLASLQDLANQINNDFGNTALVNYVAYLEEGVAGGGNDQDIGYLVNSARITVVGTPQQHNQGTTFTYCSVTDILHDRPAYVLNVMAPRAGAGTVPVTIILNHTKSLIAVDSPRPYGGSCGTEGARNREKRRLQAEDITDLIQTNSAGNVVVLGDLNAFDFNDGLGDIVGTMRGNPVAPENVVEPSVDRWSHQLTNLLYTVTADQRYSLLFEGNAQALDHVLVNGPMLAQNTDFAYGRFNADFSESYASDTNRPERLSDHDAPVAYFLFPADSDGDGVPDANDNCPDAANPDQADGDNDGIGNVCDSCPSDSDNDQDGDGVCGNVDNCPAVSNPDQANADGDALGDACDTCPNDPDNDADGDGVCGNVDNCPGTPNSDQANADGDSFGDACDACPMDAANDADGDGVCGNVDNCPSVPNPDQANADGDSFGDACDACPMDAANDVDGDGVCGNVDNCPTVYNPDQRDTNNDNVGDACTAFQFPAGGAFVIGNNVNLTGGATVYFWGSQWSQNNPMSGGAGPNSFKGFESSNSSPTCGGTWTSTAGNSSNPPATIPQFMAVIVSSSIQKNGSILSGDIQKIVVIETNPGYGPAPGHAGTGKVVAVICTSSTTSLNLGYVVDYLAMSSPPVHGMMRQRWTAGDLRP